MKRIFITSMVVVLFMNAFVFAATKEQKEIESLQQRVARLEQMVRLLQKQIAVQNYSVNTNSRNQQKVIYKSVPVVQTKSPSREKYVVTLYDNSTFLIYSWDRKILTQYDQRNNRKSTRKVYIMNDVFGKKREWSIDKVQSILRMKD